MASMGIRQLFGEWDYRVADFAYALVVQAGVGSKYARDVLKRIREAAAKGDARAVAAQAKIDAVAKFVTNGLPKPSALAARKAARQPLRQSQDAARMQQQLQEMERRYRAQQERMKAQAQAQAKAAQANAQQLTEVVEQQAEQISTLEQAAQEVAAAQAKQAALADAMPTPGENYGPNVNVISPPPGPDLDGEAAPGDVEFSGEGA